MKNQGLVYTKCDLHVHTPSSHDYPNKSVTAISLVQSAISKGLNAIAITDHNTGAFINEIQKAAKGTQLVVFPGVEITCVAGESGIHVLAIFDIIKDQNTINALLAKADIPVEKYGAKDAFSKKSLHELIEIIHDMGGLAILAHCTSSKGVLNELKGTQRTEVFKSSTLLAVESSINDYMDEEKKRNRKRAFDLLDGTDPNYNNRKLAVYSSSDAHSLEEIGRSYTYFKVDINDFNLESLRQCFIDRDVRILQSIEQIQRYTPYIKKITIKSGFFDGQETTFHPGLNTIIGAKGSGKSLLVELLRFGLNNIPVDEEVLDDHNRKLKLRLQNYGQVNIELSDETGNVMGIVREYKDNGSKYRNEDESTFISTFPILCLSQNEIIKIAENPEKQMKFIDSFFDFKQYISKIKNIENELEVLNKKFAQSINSRTNVGNLTSNLKGFEMQLKKIETQIASTEYDKFKKIDSANNAIKSVYEEFTQIEQDLSEFIEAKKVSYKLKLDEDVKELPEVKRIEESLTETTREYINLLSNAIDFISTKKKFENEEYLKWKEKYSTEKNEYEDFVKKNGVKLDLERERVKLQNTIQDIKSKMKKDEEQSTLVSSYAEARKKKLDELDGVYMDFLKERQEKCKLFEKASGGKLKIELHEATNNDIFRDTLNNLKKGTYLRGDEIDSICSCISSREFILRLLRYHIVSDEQKTKLIEETSDLCKISSETTKKLFDFLLSQNSLEDLLKLQYVARSQDRPDIMVQIGSSYESIKNVSVGQKCNAMLIIALSDGLYPVIIDQPEDSLDISSIWHDICIRIRSNKVNRQFVFTTHNSSLAVASDTDKYVVVESKSADKGLILHTGAIDSKEIKYEVIDYLEGGNDTYINKYRKYGFNIK